MAKKIITLFLIFIAFYLGAHYWIRWRNRVHVDTIKTTSLVVCEANQLRALKILQREGAREELVTLERVDSFQPGLAPAQQLAKSEWKEILPVAGEADGVLLNRLVSLLCELYDPIPLRAADMVEADNSRRGAQKLEFSLEKNGRTEWHAIEFGAVSKDRQNIIRYRDGGGEERVVKIPAQLSQLVSQPPKQFINLRVLKTTADDIQSASVTVGGKEKFLLERAGAEWRFLRGGREAKPREEVERYVNRFATLKALEAEPAAKQDCEGGAHKVKITFTRVAGEKEIVGFDYGKSGTLNACSSARSAKFKVHRDLLRYLEL